MNTVYTPQFIVGGREHVVGADAMALMKAIDAVRSEGDAIEISASHEGSTIVVQLSGGSVQADGFELCLAKFKDEIVTEVSRGENAGKALKEHFIVTDFEVIETWNGAADLEVEVVIEDSDLPAVVFLQAAVSGPIVSAVRIDR